MTAPPASHSTPWRDLALLTVLLALVLAWPIASPPIHDRGEAREALVVRDIVQHGEWVLPRRLGVIASKPPLFHWLAAAASHAVGLSDASVRVPSAIGAWVMATATLLLGHLIGGRLVGWLGVGVLLAMVGFWRSALEARVDMVFAAAVTVSLVAFWRWHERGTAGARTCCWLAAGVAALTKGPAGLVLPVLVVGATLLVLRDGRRARALWSWPLAAATVGMVVTWYAAAAFTGGADFVTVHLVRENFDRVTGRGEFAERGTRERLVLALLLRLAPWSLVLPFAIVQRLRGHRETADGVFLHAWWIVVLGVFTLSVGQRPVYLLPLYPAIALLAARAVAPWVARWPRHAIALFLALDLAALAGVQIARNVDFNNDDLPEFARNVRALLPRDAILRATLGVTEDALLTLAWTLGRDVARAPLDCDAWYLRPVPSRGDARLVDVYAATSEVSLVRCETS
jgi:4-amino-4-deoxy-L-arabinose transferase-like glycosyltransferase